MTLINFRVFFCSLTLQFYQIGATPTFKNITCNDVRKTNKNAAFITFSPGCSFQKLVQIHSTNKKRTWASATSSKVEINATNQKHTFDSAC